ncbi:MAG TPA: hypothetical protein VN306_15575, partial [Mycobacterium sp.]|nr:hypothetical protein [Mycobacterium sp.]
GRRMAVRRPQTLHASVDWSHTLLTEPERVLFRRLAVFLGGFDLAAARAVAGGTEVERYQVLDQLTLLVDKSLVVADDTGGRMRYRLLETVRQYALEKLGESGEADTVRARHRDYYTELAGLLDAPAATGHQRRVEQIEAEIDNLRAAFAWSRENVDVELALQIASSLQPLLLTRGRLREGLSWIDAALADLDTADREVAPAVLARTLADAALLDGWVGVPERRDQANEALAIARQLDDPSLLVRALTACCGTAAFTPEQAATYFAEAIELARALGDKWRLSQLLGFQVYGAVMSSGDAIAARAAGEEGRELADAIGDRFTSGLCRVWVSPGRRVCWATCRAAKRRYGRSLPTPMRPATPCAGSTASSCRLFSWGVRARLLRRSPPPKGAVSPPPSSAWSSRDSAVCRWVLHTLPRATLRPRTTLSHRAIASYRMSRLRRRTCDLGPKPNLPQAILWRPGRGPTKPCRQPPDFTGCGP